MMRLGTMIALLFMSAAVNAQTKSSSVWHPWGIAETGVVWGSYEPSGDLRLQGGVSKNDWKFGVGVAQDSYRYSSMPMYLQVHRSFTSGKRRPFAFASAGYNFATEPDYTEPWFDIWGGSTIVHQYTSGYYGELGAGYAFRTHKKWGYNLSFSYTRKTMTEKYNTTVWNGTNSVNTITQNLYRMNRFAIRIGFRIG